MKLLRCGAWCAYIISFLVSGFSQKKPGMRQKHYTPTAKESPNDQVGRYSAFRIPHSAFRIPYSAFRIPYSALRCCCCCCACLISLSLPVFSQEQLGMRLERYAGIYGAGLNPASTAFNPNNWEVSLFSADVFVANNYLYLENTSLSKVLKNTDNIRPVTDFRPETTPPAEVILLNYYATQRKMHGVVQARVSGPAFSFRVGEQHVFGLSTALRTGFSAYKIPEILRYDRISDLRLGETINIPPTGPTTAAWGEVALHYSHRNTEGDVTVAWGISPKLLLGFEGGFGRAGGRFDYTPGGGDTAAFARADWDYALTLGNVQATEQDQQVRARINGYGPGLDVGMVWSMPVEEEPEDYLWKVGVSLVDAGFIRFNRNAERHHIAFDTVITISGNDLRAPDAEGYIADASRIFLGDSTRSLQGRAFTIGMPTALSLQFDYRLAKHWYVAGLLTQRVKLNAHSLQRPNTLAIVPRFEHRWFSLSVPVVLDDWQSLRLGLAARFGFLVLGSDHVGSLLTRPEFTGTDFYIGLKINGFSFGHREKDPRGGGHKQRSSGRNVKGVKCYKF